MTKCDYVAGIYLGEEDYLPVIQSIQCANEKGHAGGHLIIVDKNE